MFGWKWTRRGSVGIGEDTREPRPKPEGRLKTIGSSELDLPSPFSLSVFVFILDEIFFFFFLVAILFYFSSLFASVLYTTHARTQLGEELRALDAGRLIWGRLFDIANVACLSWPMPKWEGTKTGGRRKGG